MFVCRSHQTAYCRIQINLALTHEIECVFIRYKIQFELIA